MIQKEDIKFNDSNKVIEFWDNINDYIEQGTVIEEIDNVFPDYFVENYKTYQELFDNMSEHYTNYYLEVFGEKVDFKITFGDAFRFIINNLKKYYNEFGYLSREHVDDILVDMYHNKYVDETKKKQDIYGVIIDVKNSLINK